jgi:hypothetical protein
MQGIKYICFNGYNTDLRRFHYRAEQLYEMHPRPFEYPKIRVKGN